MTHRSQYLLGRFEERRIGDQLICSCHATVACNEVLICMSSEPCDDSFADPHEFVLWAQQCENPNLARCRCADDHYSTEKLVELVEQRTIARLLHKALSNYPESGCYWCWRRSSVRAAGRPVSAPAHPRRHAR